ncbi:MAG: hypothetical protein OK455_04765 [Thaumarchaeota archaeon]|nr:hypothetical protein [Nitrososphaerota archaeon]
MTKTAEEEDVIKHDELLFGLVQKRMYDERTGLTSSIPKQLA